VAQASNIVQKWSRSFDRIYEISGPHGNFGGDLTRIFWSLETTTARILWGPIKGHRILQEEDFDVSQDPLKNPKRKV
jgi:hypothetical protein